MFHNNNPKF